MPSITDTYSLDMTPGTIPAVVHLSQYDIGEREMKFLLYAGSKPYSPPDGSTVTIRGGKPDGTIYEYSCNTSGNAVTVQPTEQMTAVKGFHDAEIRVYNGTNIIGSANLRIMVEPSPFPEGYRVSTTQIPAIEGAAQAATDALASRNAASAYKSQAADSASAAKNSATAAAASETAAKDSESAAKNSAAAAATSEKNAMSATPDGYNELASTFNALGLSVVDGEINVTFER